MTSFYDKVAKKFGGYAYGSNKPKYITEYTNGNPEEVFKEKLLTLSGKDINALDIGCGDGKFAFEIAQNFHHILGIDTSEELIKVALSKKEVLKIENVDFKLGDASNIDCPDNFFNIAFCRRGPSFYQEYYRVLKKGGYYLEVGVAEQDCVDIKKIFGRGQGYGKWDSSRLIKDKEEFIQVGFKIIYAEDFIYNEYYDSIEELDNFLQGVPIFEDYDSEKDRTNLETYCVKFRTEKGILLPRHRVVYVLQK